MKILFRAYFHQKMFRKKLAKKFYGQDPDPDREPDPEPDPDVFKRRIRIRSKFVQIRNTGPPRGPQ
jgi:hypothetical protein